jgi:hypothetical protein
MPYDPRRSQGIRAMTRGSVIIAGVILAAGAGDAVAMSASFWAGILRLRFMVALAAPLPGTTYAGTR